MRYKITTKIDQNQLLGKNSKTKKIAVNITFTAIYYLISIDVNR